MNWLFLRGLAREQRHWGSFPDTFASALGVNVHRLDLPGTGTEHRRPTPTSIAHIAEDVRQRWKSLKDVNPGPWSILGISLGGMVTMQWAAAHPDDFERVVLLNTSASNLSKPWERMDLGVVPSVLKALADSDPVKRERRILGITAKLIDEEQTERVAREWASYMEDRPAKRVTVLRQLWAASRFRAPATIQSPLLILCGAKDPLTNPACARKLAAHFNAPLEVHPSAGHDLPLDAPDWLAAEVQRWLGGSRDVQTSIGASGA